MKVKFWTHKEWEANCYDPGVIINDVYAIEHTEGSVHYYFASSKKIAVSGSGAVEYSDVLHVRVGDVFAIIEVLNDGN